MGKSVTDVQVINAEKRRSPHKYYVYVILVTWSDGSTLTIYRRYSRFFDMQTKLLETFPIEGGTLDPAKRVIPFLPGKIFFGRSQIKDVAMKRLKELNVYCQKLIQLEPKISQCDDVLGFFEIEPEDLDVPEYNADEGCPLYVDGMLIGGLEPSVSKLKIGKEKKAENISSPKRFDGYVAIAEYTAQSSGELSLNQGLKVEVLEKNENGWWFVNSEDAQGWVPSTYLEPESGADPKALQGPVASPGQEESYICIENFTAESADEVSLEKGTVVHVLQKNLDGWWLVRYNNREAYAPGTVLKKVSNPKTVSMVEKSQLSGVEIISSLHDVSNLMNQSSKTDNQTDAKGPSRLENRASVIVKQRSLERGGNLHPPPRQNSVNKSAAPSSPSKTNVYMTISDFTDTVGDGISFKKGQKVFVTEKSTTGWWYVKMGDKEGWVVSSYLEPFNGQLSTSSVYEMASLDDTDCANNDYDDEDWYVEPEDDGAEVVPVSDENTAKRPLPALPPNVEKSKPLPVLPTKKPEGFKLPNPPTKPNEVPSESQKTADVVLRPVSKAPDPPSKPVVKSGTDFHKKPGDNERPSSGNPLDFASQLKAKFESRSGAVATEAPEKPAAKPAVSKFGGPLVPPVKPSLPQKDSHENNHPAGGDNERSSVGGSLDFASQLKAKFESRSAGVEGSDKPAAKPGVPNSGGGAILPPGKPSLAQRDSHGNKPSAGGDIRPVLKPPSKPTGMNPPPPLKPTLPTGPKANQPTGKPTPPSAKPSPPAPPVKSGLTSESNNNKVTEPSKVISDKSNVKRLSSTFNASSNTGQEKLLPGKPQLPGKPKPPPPSKSASSNHSSVANAKPGTQNVNSLANNLSGKLNFGQNPLATKASAADEGGASSSVKPPPPASKKPAVGPSQNPPVGGSSKIVSPMSSMYIAVCSFTAENEGELGFTEGDEVEVLEEQSDWCRIRCWDEEGWAPSSYLQKL